LWITEACIKGYYTEQESYVDNNKNQRKKDVIVPDPGYKHGFWHNNSYHVINIITELYNLTVLYSQDFVC
jgi:hypothetical protein